MKLYIHVPMFGTVHVDSKPLECPFCPRGKEMGENNWAEQDIAECNPGDKITCMKCGRTVIINWGLVTDTTDELPSSNLFPSTPAVVYRFAPCTHPEGHAFHKDCRVEFVDKIDGFVVKKICSCPCHKTAAEG
jgi:hypothetical protein